MSLSFARKFLASFLLIGPALWIVASLIGPNTDHSDKHNTTANQLKDLNSIAAHKSAYLAAGTIFLVGAILFLIATYGIVHVYRGRKLGIGQVAGGLLAVGSAVFFAWYAFGLTQYEMVTHSQLTAERAIFAHFNQLANSPSAGAPLFFASLVGVILGSILLGIAAIRRRNVPLWSGVLLIVSGPATWFTNGQVASTIAQVVLLVALAPLALLIWRMSDEEWDAPREIAGQRKPKPVAEPAAPAPAPAV